MKFRIYYMRREFFREFSFGFDGKVPALDKLAETHAELRTIDAATLDAAYSEQQAHNWAQDAEACNAMLAAKGLGHTSMSVGDVAENVPTGEFFVVAPVGFKRLNPTSFAEDLQFRVMLTGDLVAAFSALRAADHYAEFLARDYDAAAIRIDTATATIIEYRDGAEGIERTISREEFDALAAATAR